MRHALSEGSECNTCALIPVASQRVLSISALIKAVAGAKDARVQGVQAADSHSAVTRLNHKMTILMMLLSL